jgi:mono/diheme cytochrome c family protein
MMRLPVLLAAVLASAAAGCYGGGGEAQPPAEPPPAETQPPATETAPPPATEAPPAEGDPEAGKAVFASAGCSGCHTLAAAGASGTVGPSLDETKPSFELVVERVTNGKGAMPSFEGQLSEQQIKDVAAFVSQNAG